MELAVKYQINCLSSPSRSMAYFSYDILLNIYSWLANTKQSPKRIWHHIFSIIYWHGTTY